MSKKEQNEKISRYVILLILLFGIMVGISILYYRSVRNWISYQVEKELRKANEMGMIALQATIDSQVERLRIVAFFCDGPDGSGEENWQRMIQNFGDDSYRIGVADLNGVFWYNGNQNKDISGTEYFKRVIAGEETVFQVLPGGFDGNSCLVIAMPIRGENNQILGVLCGEFNSVDLGRTLNAVEQVESGATLVFTRKGEMVSSYEGMDKFGDFFQMIGSMEHTREDAVEKLQGAVQSGGRGIFRYSSHDRERILYYQPAGIEDWYIVSLVDFAAYEREMGAVSRDSIMMSSIAIICAVGASVLLWLILYQIRKELEKGKRDFLTDVYDRKTSKHLFEQHVENGDGGCCFFLDIDYFKEINDTKGHVSGDRALQKTAAILKREVRREDEVSRYGGDEFCIWLWGLREEFMARNIAERIVNAFRREEEFTISMGAAFFEKGDSYEAVIKRADQALYYAKENGRNQYAILPQEPDEKKENGENPA